MGNGKDIQFMPLFYPEGIPTNQISNYLDKEAILGLRLKGEYGKTVTPASPPTVTRFMYKYELQVDALEDSDIYLYAMNHGTLRYFLMGETVSDEYTFSENVLELEPSRSLYESILPIDIHRHVRKFYFGNIDEAACETALKDNVLKLALLPWVRNKVATLLSGDPTTDDQVEAYHTLFVNGDQPIPVQAGERIGAIAADPDDSELNRLNFYVLCEFDEDAFDFIDRTDREDFIKAFFDGCRRSPGKRLFTNASQMAGHPLIALICQTSVASGRIDVVDTKLGTFNKYAHIPPIEEGHYLPIDFDRYPPTIVLQGSKSGMALDTKLDNQFGSHYGEVKLKIYNPDGRTLEIEASKDGEEEDEFSLSTDSVMTSDTVITITSRSADKGEFSLSIYDATDGSSSRVLAQTLTILQLPLKAEMVRVFKLHIPTQGVSAALPAGQVERIADLSTGNIETASKMETFFAEVNAIIGRQANVYLFPETAFVASAFEVNEIPFPEMFYSESSPSVDSVQFAAIKTALPDGTRFSVLFSTFFQNTEPSRELMESLWDITTEQDHKSLLNFLGNINPTDWDNLMADFTMAGLETLTADWESTSTPSAGAPLLIRFGGGAAVTIAKPDPSNVTDNIGVSVLFPGFPHLAITVAHEFLHQVFQVIFHQNYLVDRECPNAAGTCELTSKIHLAHVKTEFTPSKPPAFTDQDQLANNSDSSLNNNLMNSALGMNVVTDVAFNPAEQYKLTSRQAALINDNL
jgi:hypothetical protein